eukprot:1312055-Prorocentrum_lima.AAC.1
MASGGFASAPLHVAPLSSVPEAPASGVSASTTTHTAPPPPVREAIASGGFAMVSWPVALL